MTNIHELIHEFEQARMLEGIHENTIKMEVAYVKKFHNALISNGEYIPVNQISYKNVEDFFKKEREKLSDRTVYRKITIIIQYFNFLSSKSYILIDFMPKFRKRFSKLSWEEPPLALTYEDMLMHKATILERPDISFTAKLLYMFMLNGVELKDMLNFKKENVIELDHQTLISYETPFMQERTLTFSEPAEREIIREAIYTANERCIDYLLSSKADGAYHQFNPTNIPVMMRPVTDILGTLPTTKKSIYAFVLYLHKQKRYTIEDIAHHFSIPTVQALNLLKTTVNRVEQVV